MTLLPRRRDGLPRHRRRMLVALGVAAALGGCTAGQPPDGNGATPTAAGTAARATPTTASAPPQPLPSGGLLRPGTYRTDAVQGIGVTFRLASLGWAVQSVTRIQLTLEVGLAPNFDQIRAIDVVVPDLVPQPACTPVARQRLVRPPADLATWLCHHPCFQPLDAPHPVTVAGARGVEWRARTRGWTLRENGNGVAVRVAEVGRMRRRADEAPSVEELALGHLQQFDVVRVGGRQVLLIVEAPSAGFAAFRDDARRVLDTMRIAPR